jgi:hypothetical protein
MKVSPAITTKGGMKESNVKSAQEKWAVLDQWDREKLLRSLGYGGSFAKLGWNKLPYLAKDNLKRVLDKM